MKEQYLPPAVAVYALISAQQRGCTVRSYLNRLNKQPQAALLFLQWAKRWAPKIDELIEEIKSEEAHASQAAFDSMRIDVVETEVAA